jgi:hypothetical protein
MQLADPIAQDPTYHDFAATGSWWGLPNFWNVISNLALLISGAAGLTFLSKKGSLTKVAPEAVFFLGLILTAVGSAYYHYAPDNQTLIWDRLPMTIAFMALFMAMIGHCLDRKAGYRFLPLALVVGAASVIYWASSEADGQGDLRYYLVVQFLPMLLVPILLLWRPPTTLAVRWIWAMLGLYVAAKACELLDGPIASILPLELTGHVLKHLFAGASGCAFLQALKRSREYPVGNRTGIQDRTG